MISSAFPGIFSYKEILNFDFRDLRFWMREAAKQYIDDFLQQIRAVRIGMSTKGDYARIVKNLENQKTLIGIDRARIIEDNWADLKLLQPKRKRKR